MLNIEKQIAYWSNGALDDLVTAKVLFDTNRLLHGLFFCHLVIEKAIKANVVKQSSDVAPRSHNLIYLSEKANILFSEDDEIFLGILMKYQLQGRYPDYNPVFPDREKAIEYYFKTENLLTWLLKRL